MAGSERKIFIPVDGSKPANCAFKWYLDNLKKDGDKVFIVHVPEYAFKIGLPGAAVDVEGITKAAKEENDRIEIMLNTYMDQLRPLHIKAQTKLLQGSEKPGELIVKSANEEKANLIIMGSRGLGTIRRTLLGSVSEYVIHHAPPNCSVTTIRDS